MYSGQAGGGRKPVRQVRTGPLESAFDCFHQTAAPRSSPPTTMEISDASSYEEPSAKRCCAFAPTRWIARGSTHGGVPQRRRRELASPKRHVPCPCCVSCCTRRGAPWPCARRIGAQGRDHGSRRRTRDEHALQARDSIPWRSLPGIPDRRRQPCPALSRPMPTRLRGLRGHQRSHAPGGARATRIRGW